MEQLVSFLFLGDQFLGSLSNDRLQIIGVFLQLLNHAVHHVQLSENRSHIISGYKTTYTYSQLLLTENFLHLLRVIIHVPVLSSVDVARLVYVHVHVHVHSTAFAYV